MLGGLMKKLLGIAGAYLQPARTIVTQVFRCWA
jgi:hypothetical protein